MEKTQTTETPQANMQSVGQQLSYPLDHTTQRILEEYSGRQSFPIGSVFINVDGSDPRDSLGYGVWSAFGAGRTLFGFDSGNGNFDTALETGGSETHTMTVAEMPSHSHDVYIGNTGSGNPSLASGGNTIGSPNTDRLVANGGGDPFSIIPPYITVYFWKRDS